MSTLQSLNGDFPFGAYPQSGMHGDIPIHSTPTSHIRIRKHRPNYNPYTVHVHTTNPRINQAVQQIADQTLNPVEAIYAGYAMAGIKPSFEVNYPQGYGLKQYSY